MNDYKKPYLLLLTSCAAAVAALEKQNFGHAKDILLRAQREAEDAFIDNNAKNAPSHK